MKNVKIPETPMEDMLQEIRDTIAYAKRISADEAQLVYAAIFNKFNHAFGDNVMLNPRFHQEGSFNVFTQFIKDRSDAGKGTCVKMRNGDVVLVKFEYGEKGTCDEGQDWFYGQFNGRQIGWEHDGKSWVSHNFDMMEIVDL